MKKYLSNKKILAIAIILIGVWGAWLINKAPADSGKSSLIQAAALNGPNPNFQFNTSSSNIGPVVPYLNVGSVQNPNNLTDKLAQLYTQELLNRNSAGPSTDANGQLQLTVPSQDVFTNILQQNLNQNVSFTRFGDKDIRIVSGNSVQSQLNYIRALSNFTQKNLGGLDANIFSALDTFLNKNDSSALQSQINAMNNQIHDVLTLSVPSLWQQFDLEALNLWQKSLTIYQNLLAVNDDPLKTYLVLNDFQNIFQEAQSLNSVLVNRYNELTLKQ